MTKRNCALFFSYSFHPMTVSLLAFWALIFHNPDTLSNRYLVLFTCLLISNLIPIITVLILKKKGLITDIDASQKEQRILPLTLGVIYSGIGFLILRYLNADMIVQGLMFCYMTNSIITLSITRYWKISIHTMGLTAPFAALWVHGYQFPVLMVIIVICVGISRIILKAHSPAQVFTGAALGFLLTFSQLLVFFT